MYQTKNQTNQHQRPISTDLGSNNESWKNSQLLLEMSKTASLLSQQLQQLHQSLCGGQTPANKFNPLTPLSSGYNSAKMSHENLVWSNHTSLNNSLILNSSALNSSLDSSHSHGRSFASIDSSALSSSSSLSNSSISSDNKTLDSIRMKLFREEEEDEEAIINRMSSQTPLRTAVDPEIPRIKEQRREICKMKSKRFFSLKKFSLLRNSLSFSSPNLKK